MEHASRNRKVRHPVRHPSSAFTYWENGSENVKVNPDPPAPEEAKPFAVSLQTDSVIPIFVLVFARDAEHAKRRVRLALEECSKKDYGGATGAHQEKWWNRPNQAGELLKKIDGNEYVFMAHPIDIAVMTRSAWASNDTCCG